RPHTRSKRDCSSDVCSSDLPLGANPYLCVSHEMEVTPSTRKSKGSVTKPARPRNGTKNEPRQQSTWHPIRCFLANAAMATISSKIGRASCREEEKVCDE